MAKPTKNKASRKPTGLNYRNRQIVERILAHQRVPAAPEPNPTTAKPREVNTSELMGGAMESATRLRVRVLSLTDALVGNPTGEQGGNPAPCGLNSKIELVIGELRDAHDVIDKLGAYLGIEV
jgi:hypothetical protein